MQCGFHILEHELDSIIGTIHNRDLNRTPTFEVVNPTADNVARHIAESVALALPAGVTLTRLTVTEAPGCTAAYRMKRSD